MNQPEERRAQAQRTEEGLAEGTVEAVSRGAREAFAHGDELVREHVVELRILSNLACADGCSHCCHMEVSASFPEIALLATFIEQTFSAASRDALTVRLDAQCDALAPLTTRERLTRSTTCAVLVDGRCSAYEARPMACRGWNSSDVTPCIAAFDTPGAVPSIPVHRLLRDASMSLASGIQDGARASGFDDALLDLPHALRAMLRDGVPGADSLTESWLAGKMLPVVMKAQPAPERVQGSDGLWRPVA